MKYHMAHYTNIDNIDGIIEEGLKTSKHINNKDEKKCMFLGDGHYFFDYNCPNGYKIGRALSIPKQKRRDRKEKFARFSIKVKIDPNKTLNLNSPNDRKVIVSYFTQYEKYMDELGIVSKFKVKDVKIILDHIAEMLKYNNEHYGWTFGFMLNEFLNNSYDSEIDLISCKFVTNKKHRDGTLQYNLRNRTLLKKLTGPEILNSVKF